MKKWFHRLLMCFLLQCDNELKYWVDGTRHGGDNADYVAASQLDAVLSEVWKYQKTYTGLFFGPDALKMTKCQTLRKF